MLGRLETSSLYILLFKDEKASVTVINRSGQVQTPYESPVAPMSNNATDPVEFNVFDAPN